MDESVLIAVLMGGPGSEREVSLSSGKAVLEALQGEGMNAVGVESRTGLRACRRERDWPST